MEMDFSEPSIVSSRFLNTLPGEIRIIDPAELSQNAPLAISPFDDNFLADIHMDLSSSIPSPTKQQLRRENSNPGISSIGDKGKLEAEGLHRQRQHQKKSSTASLVEFLKTTGPEDVLQETQLGMAHATPTSDNKKKSRGGILLRLVIGKSTPSRKDEVESSNVVKNLTSAIAQPKLTTAGRPYYAIEVEYPLAVNPSGPLLDTSPNREKEQMQSELDYQTIMAMKKHHRISSVLASDTSMEFLVDVGQTELTPRTRRRYCSYPPSRTRYSLCRSNSLSEIASHSESIRDDGSILPGDSVSLRPAQIHRPKSNTSPSVFFQWTPIPPRHSATNSLGDAVMRSSLSSYVLSTFQEGESEAPLNDRPILPLTEVKNDTATTELMESLEMLDKLRRQKLAAEDDSMSSYATRNLRRSEANKPEVTNRSSRNVRKHSQFIKECEGFPRLAQHLNTEEAQKPNAAGVEARALASQFKSPTQDLISSRDISRPVPFPRSSHETYSIPEDDVLSLRSAVSAYRDKRRAKVRGRRQKDLDEERSRKLDEAMRLLQKDVERKTEALRRKKTDSTSTRASSSTDSATPAQFTGVENLRTPPTTPSGLPFQQFQLSPVHVLVDLPPSRRRRKLPSCHSSNGFNSVLTNGSIPSPPSSPMKSQYDALARTPIPQAISLPPNYPPPQPNVGRRISKDESEARIAALEEQMWVLEQALRVLLNHHNGGSNGEATPLLAYRSAYTTV